MGNPTASIIVPLYHAQHHVARMVEQVKQQTFMDFEAIFVDGGPGKATHDAFVEAVGSDIRFTYLFHENKGAGEARNVGIEASSGDYLAFFDADDTPHPQLLELAVARAQDTDADIVIYQARHFNASLRTEGPSPDRWDPTAYPDVFNPQEHAHNLFGDFRNWPWDKLFRRSFLDKEGIRFPALMRIEDLAFTCQALASAHTIALLDRELYTYTVNASTSSTSTLDTAPTDTIESCRLLKGFLEQRGLIDTYRRTYTQWTGLACCVGLLELEDFDAFKHAYRVLHDGGLAELNLDTATRQRLGLTDATDDTQAAGDISNGDVWSMLETIETCALDEGTFRLLQAKLAFLQRHADMLATLAEDTRDSHSFKLGNALLSPLRLFRGRGANKVK